MKNEKNQKLRGLLNYLQLMVIITTVMIITYIFFKSPTFAFAIEAVGTEFGIVTNPASSFISDSNLAPGDSITAPITVQNVGRHDFLYDITAKNENPSVDEYSLYDVAYLQINDSAKNILFDGKLNELQNYVIGVLGPQDSGANTAVLDFTISLPPECGNEFQKKSTQVTFVFNATEHPSVLPGEIIWDPPLEKPDVNTRHGKIMPISFHLVYENVIDTVKRGIELNITWVNDNGDLINHIFKVTDGTLNWNEKLEKPHYTLLFDTEEYPAKQNTYYTVTAKYGNQILGETKFMSGH